MPQLVLYMTAYCHLCEQAEAMLLTIKQQHEIYWHTQEISEDDHLTELYGTSIPVIKRLDNLSELNWPFTQDDILKFIKR